MYLRQYLFKAVSIYVIPCVRDLDLDTIFKSYWHDLIFPRLEVASVYFVILAKNSSKRKTDGRF